MTPFMLKHVQNYMLSNEDMMNVASLANDEKQSTKQNSNIDQSDKNLESSP